MISITSSTGTYPVRHVALGELFEGLPASTFVITDRNVSALAVSNFPTLVLEPGESTKTLSVFGQCLSWLAQNGATRKSTLVAFGGGVIGDLVGFVAAAYMRGVSFVQIPTTLLAQVDSSVGGKVAIDLPEGKNLAGAFKPPAEVRLCLELLQNLSQRQFSNGMAEVWKYGYILDAGLVGLLEGLRSPSDPRISEVVDRCIRLKAEVVSQDEFETTGLRAILNFGHTIGHAIERRTGYGPILHGEAISIGMVYEAFLGERLGITPKGTADTIRRQLSSIDLPVEHPILRDPRDLIDAMRTDKKASSGRLAFALLTRIGECKLIEAVDEEVLLSVLGGE